MSRTARLLVVAIALSVLASAWGQAAPPPGKPADGVYAVLRESPTKKEVLPLKAGEALVVHNHRYLKKGDDEPPRFVVVRPAPDVALDLDGEPKPIKDGA